MPVQLYQQAYHFTHVRNLPGIAEQGLLSHGRLHADGIAYVDISDREVQARRARREPVYGRAIHEYVPMYLNPRNPMLYRLRHQAAAFVMLAVDIDDFTGGDVLFSDGNAACASTRFAPDIRVAHPSRDALDALWWTALPGGRRRRCAEMLVPEGVPTGLIRGVYCLDGRVCDFASRVLRRPALVDNSMFFRP
jgi:hypothetical protein